MVRILRPTRLVAAAALVISTFAVFGASPAGAATGTLAAASNGLTVTVTSGTSANDFASLFLFNAPHTCTTNSNPNQANLAISFTSSSAAVQGVIQLNTPTLITFGSVGSGQYGVQATVAAGSYQACLLSVQNTTTILSSLAVTIVDPNATTTTTSTTTTLAPGGSTGADPAADPVAPAFTG